MNTNQKPRFSKGIYLHKSNQDFWEFILDFKSLSYTNRLGKLKDSSTEDPSSIQIEQKDYQDASTAITNVQDTLLKRFLEGYEPWTEPELPQLQNTKKKVSQYDDEETKVERKIEEPQPQKKEEEEENIEMGEYTQDEVYMSRNQMMNFDKISAKAEQLEIFLEKTEDTLQLVGFEGQIMKLQRFMKKLDQEAHEKRYPEGIREPKRPDHHPHKCNNPLHNHGSGGQHLTQKFLKISWEVIPKLPQVAKKAQEMGIMIQQLAIDTLLVIGTDEDIAKFVGEVQKIGSDESEGQDPVVERDVAISERLRANKKYLVDKSESLSLGFLPNQDNSYVNLKGKLNKIYDFLNWLYRLEQNWTQFLTKNSGKELTKDHIQKEIKIFADVKTETILKKAAEFNLVIDYEPPLFVVSGHKKDICNYVSDFLESTNALYPKYWDKTKNDESTPLKLIDLESSSPEFDSLRKLFSASMDGYQINSIQRIQNSKLIQAYIDTAKALKGENPDEILDQRLLFTGTRCIDPLAATEDPNAFALNGKIYLNVEAKKAHMTFAHVDQKKTQNFNLIVCESLLGKGYKANKSDEGLEQVPDGYLSIDAPGNYHILQNTSCCYPLYLVSYSLVQQNSYSAYAYQ